ncbi:AbrB/MazE/SpoVT family DNA-binding domain-containing protein [Phenylobacterium sp.]|uniref:AbrB/MazE/SpoVT family DNA-binding domain-containing protein n=1 Tax=Phenylobacterium sp. TaxID=1871053 RepID=UPI0025ED5C4B|nr:AbrB/MazE/SpoVT family DNA-binding domain-containing protein [Phenylobacterium sp.]MBX3485700.1 AbrB/MazE/SpoVT family DNA-binding domain-containing protein [Phenylobacterium sp.]
MTWADKIRALDAAGHSRAEIQKLLGKRYQHVRNVLEGDKFGRRSRTPAAIPEYEAPPEHGGVAEPMQTFGGVHRLTVEADGSIRLPAAAQAVLGLRPGSVLIAELGEDRLVILNAGAAMARVDALMAPFRWQGGPLASDELIAERRAEAARESDA